MPEPTADYAVDDTVRVDGLRGRWVVDSIKPYTLNGAAPTVTVSQTRNVGRDVRVSEVEVYPTRVHLILKGNPDQDLIDAMDAMNAIPAGPARDAARVDYLRLLNA